MICLNRSRNLSHALTRFAQRAIVFGAILRTTPGKNSRYQRPTEKNYSVVLRSPPRCNTSLDPHAPNFASFLGNSPLYDAK